MEKYLDVIDPQAVQEIHLAGFTKKEINGGSILIDTHSTFVSQDVWDIYSRYISSTKTDAITLIEWDLDIPPLTTLIAEHTKAKNIRQQIDGGGSNES